MKPSIEKFSIRVEKRLHQMLVKEARMKSVSLNSLVSSAIESYLTDDPQKKANDTYLLSLSRALKSLSVDVDLLGELISFFTFHWFCYTPDLPDNQKRALFVEGKKRHERFLELLTQKIQRGEMSFSTLSPYSHKTEGAGDEPEDEKLP